MNKIIDVKFFTIPFILLIATNLMAKSKQNEKFGEVKFEDFNPKSSVITKDDAAIILSDVSNTEFEGNTNGGFNVIFKRHKKILINKSNAFNEATVEVQLLEISSSSEEKMEDILGATYNLVNGKIETTMLNKDGILKQKITRNRFIKKFTLPNIKEKCIIEYSYTIRSPFDSKLKTWYFQDKYPTLWSECQLIVPPPHNYSIIRNGVYKKLAIDSAAKIYRVYTVIFNTYSGPSESTEIKGDAKMALWAMKDVPAFKIQDYVANPGDNIAHYEFPLLSIKFSETNFVNKQKNWFKLANELLADEYFGEILDKTKTDWIEKEVDILTGNTVGIEAAIKIYNYIKDNFICDDEDALVMSDNAKKIFKNKKGNVADINLMLTAYLYNKGYVAEPVILSKVGYGKPNETTPFLNQYNYVICRLMIDSTEYFLDASDKKLGFGKLHQNCYNGFARSISGFPRLIDLSASKCKEIKNTAIFIANGAKGVEASVNSTLGYQESQGIRQQIEKTTTKDFFKTIAKAYSFDVKLENEEIENLKTFENPLTIKYDFKLDFNEDVVYFSPLLAETQKENIFKSEQRIFNIEMPNAYDETIVLNMEIPTGYMVDEMPKSTKTSLNDGEGYFEYIAINRDGQIQLRSRFQLLKTKFDVEDYESLKDFFGFMVKKHSEQIVFKKIKK